MPNLLFLPDVAYVSPILFISVWIFAGLLCGKKGAKKAKPPKQPIEHKDPELLHLQLKEIEGMSRKDVCSTESVGNELVRPKDTGIQINYEDVLERYGREQGTQLFRDQRSFAKAAVIQSVKLPMNKINTRLVAALLDAMEPEDEELAFCDLPLCPLVNGKVLKRISTLYLRPQWMVEKHPEFDWAELDRLLKEAEIQATAQQVEAIALIREVLVAGTPFTDAHIQQIYDAFYDEIHGMKVRHRTLNKLFDVLIESGLLAGDVTEYRNKLSERPHEEKQTFVTIIDLVASLQADLEIEEVEQTNQMQSTLILVTHKSQKTTQCLPSQQGNKSNMSQQGNKSNMSEVSTQSAFFGASPSQRTSAPVYHWEDARLCADIAQAMAPGGEKLEFDHGNVVADDDNIAAQHIMADLAQSYIAARPFEAHGPQNQSQKSQVELVSVAKSQTGRSMKSVAPITEVSTKSAIPLSTVTDGAPKALPPGSPKRSGSPVALPRESSKRTGAPKQTGAFAVPPQQSPARTGASASLPLESPAKAVKQPMADMDQLNKVKLLKLLKVLKKDPDYKKDKEKNECVEQLEAAINNNRNLTLAQLEQIMNVISREVVVQPHAITRVLDRMIASKTLDRKNRQNVLNDVTAAKGTQRGLKMIELQKIVSKYAQTAH